MNRVTTNGDFHEYALDEFWGAFLERRTRSYRTRQPIGGVSAISGLLPTSAASIAFRTYVSVNCLPSGLSIPSRPCRRPFAWSSTKNSGV